MSAATTREVGAQGTPVHEYYVNDGKNDTNEIALGEFSIDLGGHLPFARYSDVSPSTGHFFARQWTGANLFLTEMFKGSLDLDYLNGLTSNPANINPPVPIVPFSTAQVFVDPETTIVPVSGLSWWGREILYWPFKLNGGSVMICIRGDGSGNIDRGTTNPASILLFNYSHHLSAFGTNKNRFKDYPGAGGPKRQYSGSATSIFFAESGWPGPPGSPVLSPSEQAIESGDIVVLVQENFSMELWIALQRTLEAEWFTRNTFAAAPPKTGGPPFAAIPIDRSFVHGGSHGRIVSMVLSMLQPRIYSGHPWWLMSDVGFGIQDWFELENHQSAASGRIEWTLPNSTLWVNYYQIVDLLGIRFDDAKFGNQPWDLAAFSLNRRPGHLKVPIRGGVGDNEFSFPAHWPEDDSAQPAYGGLLDVKVFRNTEHATAYGYIPGVNEIAIFDGSEWGDLKSAGAPAGTNSPLVPMTALSGPAYPDPYTHTLRHAHFFPPNGTPPLLSVADVHNGLSPAYRKSGLPAGANLETLGQGIWPGLGDHMHVLDVDGDTKLEVVFGNFEGFVHVLEFSEDPTDPFKLYDEWRSPYLGRGIVASDCFFNGSLARMFFSDSRGQIWRINANGADSYSIANGGQPIATPSSGGGKFLYEGPSPFLLVNDFDGGNGTGKEILALNRFLDWSLFDLSGSPMTNDRLPRGTRIIGPTDVFPAEMDQADSQKELLVCASDGLVWKLNQDPGSPTGGWFEKPDPVLPFTGLSLNRLIPLYTNSSGVPSHLLLFGRNSDLDDLDPAANTNIIQLWDLGAQTLLASTPTALGDRFGGISFAWIQKVSPSSPVGMFAIATYSTIEVFSVFVSPVPLIGAVSSKQIFPLHAAEGSGLDCITSLDCALLFDGSGESKHLIYTTCKGRVFVLDTALNFKRFSDREAMPPPLPPGRNGTVTPWPSNRTLAGTYPFDLENPTPGTGTGDLHFVEYPAAAWVEGANSRYRMGRIRFGATNTWSPYLTDPLGTVIEARAGVPWDESSIARPDFIRTLLYRDLDGDQVREARVFSETGTALLDDRLDPDQVREFQTGSFEANFVSDWDATAILNAARFQGGRVFERLAPATAPEFDYLGGFTIPLDPTVNYFDSSGGAGTSGWWYPKVGTNFLTGQLASHQQSVFDLSLGTSMKQARMRKNQSAPEPTPHVVIGCNNGYVYAIEPGTTATPALGLQGSNLSYTSRDLGSLILGLDVANLDTDPDDEIVCGSWVDKGTFVDWHQHPLPPLADRNRGKLYVLDPTTGGAFNVTELTGDDYFAPISVPNGHGIGSGVSGVRIDDVNADGTKEIWCVDVFHVYLFKQSAGAWTCFYRSEGLYGSNELPSYPGVHNNLFPIKDATNKTVKLVVASPGYVMQFNVDPNVVGL